jgi:hypothetical protein
MKMSGTMMSSALWRTALEGTEEGHFPTEHARFRSCLLTFRNRAAELATHIRKDLPDLTVHDVTHFDSLWEIASEIAGPDYNLTPSEGFALGGAILLHDLGLSLAATRAATSQYGKIPVGPTSLLLNTIPGTAEIPRWKKFRTRRNECVEQHSSTS